MCVCIHNFSLFFFCAVDLWHFIQSNTSTADGAEGFSSDDSIPALSDEEKSIDSIEDLEASFTSLNVGVPQDTGLPLKEEQELEDSLASSAITSPVRRTKMKTTISVLLKQMIETSCR